MLIKSLLRGFVVHGANRENAIYARPIYGSDFFQNTCRAIPTTSHQEWNATIYLSNDVFLNALALFATQARSFSSRAKNTEEIDTTTQMPIN